MSNFETIIARLEGASKPHSSKAGASVRAVCPACGGSNRSKLIVTEQPTGNVLIHCFSGCAPADILNAIGLDFGDLFADHKRSKPTTVRHDPRALVSIAAVTCEEVEFMLLAHNVKPVEGIAGRLMDAADRLKQIKEFLQQKGATK